MSGREPRQRAIGESPEQSATNRELLGLIKEAARLTFNVDLHFCDREDRELAGAIDHIYAQADELRYVWPCSTTEPDPASTFTAEVWADVRRTLTHLESHVATVQKRLRALPDRVDKQTLTAGICVAALRTWWGQLAETIHRLIDKQRPGPQAPPDLGESLEAAAKTLPRHLVRCHEPAAFLQGLRPPGGSTLDESAYQRLARRIAKRWNVQRRDDTCDIELSLQLMEQTEGVGPAEAKVDAVQRVLAGAVGRADRPEHVRLGPKWIKRTPVRASAAPYPEQKKQTAARVEAVARELVKQRQERVRVWPEDLAPYAFWKWLCNRTIGAAEELLTIEYPPTDAEGEPSKEPDLGARLAAQLTIEEVFGKADLTKRQAEVWLAVEVEGEMRERLARCYGIELGPNRETREQVAHRLGTAVGTVDSHLNRARNALRATADKIAT